MKRAKTSSNPHSFKNPKGSEMGQGLVKDVKVGVEGRILPTDSLPLRSSYLQAIQGLDRTIKVKKG